MVSQKVLLNPVNPISGIHSNAKSKYNSALNKVHSNVVLRGADKGEKVYMTDDE